MSKKLKQPPIYYLITMCRDKEIIDKNLNLLKEAILNGDSEAAKNAALMLSESEVSVVKIIDEAIKPAMDILGEKYERLEIFLPELVLAGEAAQEALKILLPKGGTQVFKGKIVIGTIYGDIHDIGKNIVSAMLSANGYQIIDLGNDVHPTKFVEVAKTESADIIGISCLLTPSMFYMRDVIQRLIDENIRSKFYIIVGGAAVSPEWAKEIGADGWAKDAERAVELCNILMERGSKVEKPIIIGEWR
ncbi:MAG: cobalamin-dependent protein [Candidatus Methanomethylicia archaeon]